MQVLPQHFTVDYRFDVVFTRDVFAPDNQVLADLLAPPAGGRPSRALVYLDQGVLAGDPGLPRRIHTWFAAHQGAGVRLAAEPGAVPGGEAAKDSLALVERVARDASQHGLCRHSWILIIGGGAVLDAVGLAASLVHRGIRQVRLPTTTLAQADAGLGVKNAVNALGQKNLLGTFTPPRAVVNDGRFLDQLDDRAWRAGVAEAVKVAAIRDAGFARELAALAPRLAAREGAAMERAVRRCAELHLAHITGAGDPFEQGTSRPLDFGHWSAHRLEMLSNQRLGHGEAVAIGVALDLLYAALGGRIAEADAQALIGCLHTCGFRLWDEALDLAGADGRRAVLGGLEQFREHLGGELTLAMPDGLGRSRDVNGIDETQFERALAQLRRWRPQGSSLVASPLGR
ncbi:MAG: 3-dehydroquinate synthase [Planctomycetes bacterium]|nr:3-dehydroquinate synthase [Planctomycetota bacterium]